MLEVLKVRQVHDSERTTDSITVIIHKPGKKDKEINVWTRCCSNEYHLDIRFVNSIFLRCSVLAVTEGMAGR